MTGPFGVGGGVAPGAGGGAEIASVRFDAGLGVETTPDELMAEISADVGLA